MPFYVTVGYTPRRLFYSVAICPRWFDRANERDMPSCSKNRKYTIKEKDTEVCVERERENFSDSQLSDIHSSFLRTTPHVLHRGWDLSATAGHQDRLQKGPSPHRVFHIFCPALPFSAFVFNEGDARLSTFAASDTRWTLGNNGPPLSLTWAHGDTIGRENGQLLFLLFPALWQE